MSHCVICFDEGTPDHPLVRPCSTCTLETHNDCILNLASTHIIAKRAAYRHNLIPKFKNPNVFASLDGTLLLDSNYRTLLLNTPFDETESHYIKYFRQGAISIRPPNIGLTNPLDVILMRDLEHPMIYITDICPQCKKTLSFTSPINLFLPPRSVFSHDTLCSFERITSKVRGLYYVGKLLAPHLLCEYGESLMCIVSIAFPLLPWIFLGRNISEYKDALMGANGALELVELSDMFSLVSYTSSTFNVVSWLRLAWLGMKATKTFPSYVKFLAFIVKHTSDLLYALTFNMCYMNWLIDIDPQLVISYVNLNRSTPTSIETIKEMSFQEKLLYCSAIDFKTELIRTWDPNFGDYVLKATSFGSLDSPFESILYTFLGVSLGHKIIGKCKPLVKFIYRAFKKYKPVPIEMDMCFEYLGYQTVLLSKAVYEFFCVYSEYKSVKSYRVLPTVQM